MSNDNEFGYTPGGGNFPLLAEGTHDAVLHGIVSLGRQEGGEWQGKKKPPAVKLKFIFELPNDLRQDETKLPNLATKRVNLSAHIERGGFAKLLKAFGEKPTEQNIMSLMSKESLTKLLGRPVVLEIAHFEGAKGAASYVEELSKFDVRVAPEHHPKPVRETFYFNPRYPDLKIFNELLTYHTKSEVMAALDADQFPKELHEAWAKAQEAQAAKEGDKPAKQEPFVADNYNTESIE